MRANHGVAAIFAVVFGISAMVLSAQKGHEAQASSLFPLTAKKQWTMEQTIYLGGKLQSEKRDIVFTVVANRKAKDTESDEVETRVSGIFTERETFLETAPGSPIFLYRIKTPNPETSVVFKPAIDVLRSGMKPGRTWTWSGVELVGTRKKKRKATRKFRVYDFEKVTTPAGVYNAVSVDETRSPGIVTRTWFAPAVGIVKRTIIGGNTKTVFLLSVPGK